jgi:hypothetical protein
VSLGNKAVRTDILGDAYEYLIGKFADVTKRNKAGEFLHPRSVVRMMWKCSTRRGARASTIRPAHRRMLSVPSNTYNAPAGTHARFWQDLRPREESHHCVHRAN